jgi:hypothetical protein
MSDMSVLPVPPDGCGGCADRDMVIAVQAAQIEAQAAEVRDLRERLERLSARSSPSRWRRWHRRHAPAISRPGCAAAGRAGVNFTASIPVWRT